MGCPARSFEKANVDILSESANRSDLRAGTIALILAVLIHILILRYVPDTFTAPLPEKTQDLKLEIIPPQIRKTVPKFVEANPLANSMEPASKDAPESYKTQRAADEITDPTSKSKMPYVEGEIKDGSKIVSGTSSDIAAVIDPNQVMEVLKRPLLPPTREYLPESNSSQSGSSERPQKESAADTESSAPKIEESKAGKSSKGAESARDLAVDTESFLPRKGIEDSQLQKKSLGDSYKRVESPKPKDAPKSEKKSEKPKKAEEIPEDKNLPVPQRRPSLSNMKTPAGPLADNRFHASARGTLAVDSVFSEFGAYQQRMIEAISRQWNLIGGQYDLSSAIGSQVVIEFTLNVHGELTKLKVLNSTSTNTGRGLCEQSILTTAPYGPWTEEMIATLGSQDQPVRINFYYR